MGLWIFWPTHFFTRTIGRVNLRVYSRFQNNSKELANLVEGTIRANFIFFIPISVLLVSFVVPIIEHVYTSKWMPAAPIVPILTCYVITRFGIDPLLDVLVALGHAQKVFILSLLWTLSITVTGVFLVREFGLIGMALAYAFCTTIILVAVYKVATSALQVRIFQVIVGPIFSGGIMWGIIFAAQLWLEPTIVSVPLLGAFGFLVYIGSLFVLERDRLQDEFCWARSILRKVNEEVQEGNVSVL